MRVKVLGRYNQKHGATLGNFFMDDSDYTAMIRSAKESGFEFTSKLEVPDDISKKFRMIYIPKEDYDMFATNPELRTSQVGDKFWYGEKGKGSSVESTGDKLYSYGTVILQRLEDGTIIGNKTKYSHTTTIHQSRTKVSNADVFVDHVPRGTTDLREYLATENPLSQFCCSVCAKEGHRHCAPKRTLEHGGMEERMSWMRNHYKKYHPKLFAKQVKKGVTTRKANRKNEIVKVSVPWYNKPLFGVLNPTNPYPDYNTYQIKFTILNIAGTKRYVETRNIDAYSETHARNTLHDFYSNSKPRILSIKKIAEHKV